MRELNSQRGGEPGGPATGQLPHEGQPSHEASEVELVGDGGGAMDFQAQQAAVEKEKIVKGLGPKGGLRADYWRWLKPVLERRGPSKPLQCLLKCTRDGEGVCGKLLSSENPSKSAKEHFTSKGCMVSAKRRGR